MADIELVIKIPEEDFERCKKKFQMHINIMGDAIAKGILLPKGHGRLVDTSYFEHYLRDTYIDSVGFNRAMNAMKQLPTIIEADKSESEE